MQSDALRGCARLQAIAAGGPALTIGSRGEAVRVLRAALRGVGYPPGGSMRSGAPDGEYDGDFADAVRALQRDHGLTVSATAGRDVLLQLDALLLQAQAKPAIGLRPRMHTVPAASTSVSVQPEFDRPYAVNVDAGDRAMAATHGGLVGPLVSVPIRPLFTVLHAETTARLRTLCGETLTVLRRVGCGADRSFEGFAVAMARVLDEIADTEVAQGPLQQIHTSPTGDRRRDMIHEVVRSFGGTQMQAREIAERLLGLHAGRRTPGLRLTNLPTNREVMAGLFRSGCQLHQRLEALRRQAYAPHDGGAPQVLELLQAFPGLADGVYAAAGLEHVTGFPPHVDGTTNQRGDRFVRTAIAWVERQQSREALKAAGLVIAGLAIGVVSFGTLSPLAATLTSAGYGLALGASNVAALHAADRHTRDAYAIGATTSAHADASTAALRGAWGQLVVDALTAGALSRLGGAANVSRLAQFVRVHLVSGAGTALSTACDPRVSGHANAAGIILFATALGTVTDGASDALTARALRRLSPGAPVQLVFPERHVREGSTVFWATAERQIPAQAVVSRVDAPQSRLVVRLHDGRDLSLRIERTAHLELTEPSLSPHAFAAGTRLDLADVERFGVDQELAVLLQRYAAKHNIVIQLRGSSVASMNQRRAGAFPKPYDLKPKSVNAVDVQIGIGREQDVGLVAHKLPEIRPGDARWGTLTAAQQARVHSRIESYQANEQAVDALVKQGGWRRVGRYRKEPYKARVDEFGIVRDERGRAFAGDVDMYFMTRADGHPLDRADRIRHTRAIIDMTGAQVQHIGMTPDWEPRSPALIAERDRIMTTYGPAGTENLLEINPLGLFAGRGPDPGTHQRPSASLGSVGPRR